MIEADIKALEKKHPQYVAAVNKHYWWNFIFIALDSSFYSIPLAALSQDTIAPYFVAQFTDRQWVIGLIPALFYFGYFVPQLIGAFISNRRQTRKWIIFYIAVAERLGILAIAILAQLMGILPDVWILAAFFIAYTVFSVTNGMISPGYADFISKTIIKNRGVFYGVMNGLGGALGFLAALVIRDLLDAHPFPVNIQTIFWLSLGASIISPFFIAAFRETPFPEVYPVEPFRKFLARIPLTFQENGPFRKFLITRALLGFGIMGNAFYALAAIERFELTAGFLAIFTMIIQLSKSIIGLFWGWLGDRLGYKLVYLLVAGLIACMGLLSLLGFSPTAFTLIAVCIGGVYAAVYIADPNMVFAITPSSDTSRYIAVMNTTVTPIMAIAPLFGGLIVDLFSRSVLFAVVLFIGIGSLFLVKLGMPDSRGAHTTPEQHHS